MKVTLSRQPSVPRLPGVVDTGNDHAVADAEGMDPVAELELDRSAQDRVQVDGARVMHGKRLIRFVIDNHPLHLSRRQTYLQMVGHTGS